METGSIPAAFPAHNWNSIRNCKHGLWDINAPLNSLEWGGMGGGEQGPGQTDREQEKGSRDREKGSDPPAPAPGDEEGAVQQLWGSFGADPQNM